MMIKATIDGKEVTVSKGTTILEAARRIGIYIPTLCNHPDLPKARDIQCAAFVFHGTQKINGTPNTKFDGCKLCVVEVSGNDTLVTSCDTELSEGSIIQSSTEPVKKSRQESLSILLAKHPHACLICAQKEGCSRTSCSSNVPINERCCNKFGNCELRKVTEYVGVKQDTPKYVPLGMPVVKNEPLFERDYNLCIGCTRCVRVCKDVRSVEAIDVIYNGERFLSGTKFQSANESDCRFCGACVEVCPTGALMDKDLKGKKEEALVPCKYSCPAGIDIPLYVNLISERKYDDALSVIREQVPFPSVLGRICFHPCETVCRRGLINEPISICTLKRYVSDNDKSGWKNHIRKIPSTGKKIAIIGSGPSGLTAAYYLSLKGHSVTVFETAPIPGGMLTQGIPEFRLPAEIVKKEINEIMNLGVEIKLNVSSDKIALIEMQKSFDAVLVAIGLQGSKRIKLEGSEHPDVYWGLDFLKQTRLGNKPKLGRHVVVIGGGNVAVDVALTAKHLGVETVEMACLEKRDEMPAFKWEIEEAEEFGVIVHTSWGPKKILVDNNKICGIELVCCTDVFDSEKRFNPKFDQSRTSSLKCDTVILAIGQSINMTNLQVESIQTIGGFIKANPATLETSIKGIFASGDVCGGRLSVIDAIASGRHAAESMDKFLGGDGVVLHQLYTKGDTNKKLGNVKGFGRLPRIKTKGFDEKSALEEANRCLRCDLRFTISCVIYPPEDILPFNEENIANIPSIEGVIQLFDAEKKTLFIKGVTNMVDALKEQISSNSKAKFFKFEKDPMYTKRETELLQGYMQQFGKLPKCNDELDDLF